MRKFKLIFFSFLILFTFGISNNYIYAIVMDSDEQPLNELNMSDWGLVLEGSSDYEVLWDYEYSVGDYLYMYYDVSIVKDIEINTYCYDPFPPYEDRFYMDILYDSDIIATDVYLTVGGVDYNLFKFDLNGACAFSIEFESFDKTLSSSDWLAYVQDNTYISTNHYYWKLVSDFSSIVEAYEVGYALGYDHGHLIGFNSGNSVGVDSGYTTGYSDGLIVGYDDGYAIGFHHGVLSVDTGFYYDAGELAGYTQGYDIGVALNGWLDADVDGYDDLSYNTGYNIGFDDGADFDSLSWLKAVFWFIAVLFNIEFLPNVSIGTIAIFWIILLVLPALFGLITFASKR